MSPPRIFSSTFDSGTKTISLDGQAAIHIVKVLRLKAGDCIEIFDGHGLQCTSHIAHINKQQVVLDIDHCEPVSRESPLSITLIQGIARGERMDWALQKATELGVNRLIPVFMARSVVKLDSKRTESRIRHWQGITTHACEQCGRNVLPRLEVPADSLAAALDIDQSDSRFFLDPDSSFRIKQIKTQPGALCLIVGPEGGFDNSELVLMQSLGIQGLGLGPRVLRTESAGIVALSAFGAIWGDL